MNQQQQPDSEEQNVVNEFFRDLLGGAKIIGWIAVLGAAKGLFDAQNKIIDRVFGDKKK
jgi:hypothetical protein